MALKTILKEIDSYTFDESLKMDAQTKKKYEIQQSEEDRKAYDDKWDQLDKLIKDSGEAHYETPAIPFTSDKLICDFNSLYKNIYYKEKYVNL